MVKDLKQYHLKHYFETSFELSMEDATKKTCIIPLVVCDKSMANAFEVNTNPRHPDYVGVKQHPFCYPNSVVDKVRIGASLSMPVAGQETGIYTVKYRLMKIAMSFDDHDVEDDIGGEQLDTLLGMKKHSSGNYLEPIWNGTDISAYDLYPSASTYQSLTTDDKVEGVTWDDDNLINAVRESTISKKLMACTPGGLVDGKCRREFPSDMKPEWFDVPSKCRRQNEYTFFGLMFDVPNGLLDQQYYTASETTAVSHLRFSLSVYFNEKNNEFVRN